MIRDNLTTFAKAKALNTGGAGSYTLGDVVDLGVTGRDIGAGVPPLFFVALIDTTATSGGSATLALNLVTSDNADLSSGTTVLTVPATPVASLVAGYRIVAVSLPAAVYKQYLGVQQVTGTAAFTAGAISAFLVEDVNAIRAYADSI